MKIFHHPTMKKSRNLSNKQVDRSLIALDIVNMGFQTDIQILGSAFFEEEKSGQEEKVPNFCIEGPCLNY